MNDPENLLSEPTTPTTSLSEDIRDAKTGRFVKGNKAHDKYKIERKKEKAAPILAAITEEFSPDEIRLMMRRAWDVAEDEGDAKALLEILKFIAAYAIGKPVTRSISAQFGKDDLLDLFGRRSEESDDDGNTIDAE